MTDLLREQRNRLPRSPRWNVIPCRPDAGCAIVGTAPCLPWVSDGARRIKSDEDTPTNSKKRWCYSCVRAIAQNSVGNAAAVDRTRPREVLPNRAGSIWRRSESRDHAADELCEKNRSTRNGSPAL